MNSRAISSMAVGIALHPMLTLHTGTYVLRDDLHLSTPYLHPTETTATNPNGLTTTVHPPTAGTKLSLATIVPRKTRPYLSKSHSSSSIFPQIPAYAGQGESSRDDHVARPDSGDSTVPQGSSGNSSIQLSTELTNGTAGSENEAAPVFGQSNMLLAAPTSKDPSKRRKPKNNIAKSNSSFISRVILHENLAKKLQERNPDGIYGFANINRAVQWLDFSSPNKVRHPPTHIRLELTEYRLIS